MKRLLLLLCFLSVFTLCACGTNNAGNPEPAQSSRLLGEIDGNTYTNDIFGFSAAIPEDWETADVQQMSRFFGTSQDYAAEATGLEPESWVFIFYCSKYVYGYEGSNPGVGVQVSNQAAVKSLLTSEDALNDYAQQCRSSIEQQYGDSDAELSCESGVQIGSNKYSVIYVSADFNGKPIKQDVYILGIKDYVLMITETYSDESEKTEADTFIESLKVE